jgi:hypothetical protein
VEPTTFSVLIVGTYTSYKQRSCWREVRVWTERSAVQRDVGDVVADRARLSRLEQRGKTSASLYNQIHQYIYIHFITPHSLRGHCMNAKTVPKRLEGLRRESLRHNVRVLLTGRHMKNA